jgi:hypothetical protein
MLTVASAHQYMRSQTWCFEVCLKPSDHLHLRINSSINGFALRQTWGCVMRRATPEVTVSWMAAGERNDAAPSWGGLEDEPIPESVFHAGAATGERDQPPLSAGFVADDERGSNDVVVVVLAAAAGGGGEGVSEATRRFHAISPVPPCARPWFRVWGLGFRVQGLGFGV